MNPASTPPAANSGRFIAALLSIHQLAHDVVTVVVGVLFVVSLASSIPLAIGLMLLAAFGQLGL